jgi:hypothetical protein
MTKVSPETFAWLTVIYFLSGTLGLPALCTIYREQLGDWIFLILLSYSASVALMMIENDKRQCAKSRRDNNG